MLDKSIKNTLFYFSNIVIISLIKDKEEYILFFIFLLIYSLFSRSNMKKAATLFLGGIFFTLPPLILGSLSYSDGFHFSLEVSLLLRIVVSLLSTGIYIKDMTLINFLKILGILHVPNLILEITVYMFKFSTILKRNYSLSEIALRSRYGKFNLENIGKLLVGVLKRAYLDIKNMEIAMYSRGYSGRYIFRKEKDKVSIKSIIFHFVYIVATTYILRRWI